MNQIVKGRNELRGRWAWGVNGIASVLGVVVAIFYGFAVASLVAAACYAFALGHVLIGRWPAAAPGP